MLDVLIAVAMTGGITVPVMLHAYVTDMRSRGIRPFGAVKKG